MLKRQMTLSPSQCSLGSHNVRMPVKFTILHQGLWRGVGQVTGLVNCINMNIPVVCSTKVGVRDVCCKKTGMQLLTSRLFGMFVPGTSPSVKGTCSQDFRECERALVMWMEQVF